MPSAIAEQVAQERARIETDFLNTAEAAAYLGVTIGTLEVWRCSKRYEIPYYKAGRLVKYRRSDLDAWLESRRVSPEPVTA